MDMAPLDTWIRTGEVIIGGVRIIGFQRGSQMSWFQWTRFMEEVTLLGHVTLQHKKIGWFPTWLPTWFSNVVVLIQVVVLSEPLVKFPVAIK